MSYKLNLSYILKGFQEMEMTIDKLSHPEIHHTNDT